MSPNHQRLWAIAKILSYAGGILVAVCGLIIGFGKTEPPDWLFDIALVAVGVGVILGTFVVARSSKRDV